jgi:hypothetical protein
VKLRILAGLITGLAISTSAIATPIVVNGSFESGLNGWTTAGSGVTPGIGITVLTTGGPTRRAMAITYRTTIAPHAAFLVDDVATEALFQLVPLVGGTRYVFSYARYATGSGVANPFTFSL